MYTKLELENELDSPRILFAKVSLIGKTQKNVTYSNRKNSNQILILIINFIFYKVFYPTKPAKSVWKVQVISITIEFIVVLFWLSRN